MQSVIRTEFISSLASNSLNIIRQSSHLSSKSAAAAYPKFLGTISSRNRHSRLITRASSMEASHGSDNCIFCKIRDGVIPSYKILETEHCLAFLDAFPMTKGHSLLIPKKHYAFMEDIPSDEAANFMKELPRLAKAIRTVTGAEGVNIVQNNGSAGGQVVFHVHCHIVPRTNGDGLVKFAHTGDMISPDVANPIKEEIISSLSSISFFKLN